jgi:uncharacterized protein with beta-barrel porin domain
VAASVLAGAAAARAADVEITTNSANVNLDTFAGTTAHVATGITVTGSPALSATLQAWSLSNDGSLSGSNTVRFTKGGDVTNNAGGTIGSTTSAIILGTSGVGGVGSVTNFGSITGGASGDTVLLYGGGTVTNALGASITTSNTSNAVSISGGTTRTVINSGLISNTGGSFASGILIQGAGATNTITNNATGQIIGGYNGIFASSTAVLTLNNFGAISSTRGPAVEAQAGGTITNRGTITNSGPGTAANLNGILVRNTSSAEVINSGTISGATNAINFTATGGGAVGATHTVRLQTGSVLNGNVLGGTGTDNLILEGTGSETIAKFSNFETLAMQGSDWTLNGSGTFSTSTTVSSGTLRVAGQLTSPAVTVQAGGTLAGTGTIVGAVTNSGTVRVDSGTLTVNGNFVNQAGATYAVGVTPASAGLLAITGGGHTAALNGGTVQVLASIGAYGASTSYTILSATAGVTGTFAGATSNFAFLAPSLTYDATNVYLTLVRNSTAFAAVGNTRNQIATGGALDGLGLANPLVAAALALTTDQARAALDALSGDMHPGLRSLLLGDSSLVREAMLARLAGGGVGGTPLAMAFTLDDAVHPAPLAYAAPRRTAVPWPLRPPASTRPVYTVWAQGYGTWTRLRSDGNAGELRASGGGGFGGLDVTLANTLRFGLVVGAGHSDADSPARAARAGIDTGHVGAFAGLRVVGVELRGGAAFASHDIGTSRTAAFGAFADTPTARYRATTWQGFGEIARPIALGRVTGEAFVNLAHARVATDGFAERGGAAVLTAAATANALTWTTVGLRGRAELTPLAGWPLAARAMIGWRHAFDPAAPVTTMTLAGSTTFPIAGVPLAADTLAVEAGLEAMLSASTRAQLGYAGRFASSATDHALKGAVAVGF